MQDETAPVPPVEDLFDFYRRWPDLRPQMVRLVQSDRLSPAERTILSAMLDLVDRVGPTDISGT